jgi:hypothetical protein
LNTFIYLPPPYFYLHPAIWDMKDKKKLPSGGLGEKREE